MVYLVWEKIRLKRKVLSCVLNSGRYRRLEGREFQTDGAMKLKKRSPQRFHITFRNFLEGVWCLMCADATSMFGMCRHSLSVCYVQTQSVFPSPLPALPTAGKQPSSKQPAASVLSAHSLPVSRITIPSCFQVSKQPQSFYLPLLMFLF